MKILVTTVFFSKRRVSESITRRKTNLTKGESISVPNDGTE